MSDGRDERSRARGRIKPTQDSRRPQQSPYDRPPRGRGPGGLSRPPEGRGGNGGRGGFPPNGRAQLERPQHSAYFQPFRASSSYSQPQSSFSQPLRLSYFQLPRSLYSQPPRASSYQPPYGQRPAAFQPGQSFRRSDSRPPRPDRPPDLSQPGPSHAQSLEHVQLPRSAEFSIHLAEVNNIVDLIKNGVEFPVSFTSNLLQIIQHTKPKTFTSSSEKNFDRADADCKKERFPYLAKANDPALMLEEDVKVANEATAEHNALSSRKDNDKTPHRSRSRSHSRERSKERRRSRSRSRSRERHRQAHSHRSSKEQHSCWEHKREREKDIERLSPLEPEVGKIFEGEVTKIMQNGCFVQFEDLQKRWEGFVHFSQLRRKGRVTYVSDVVQRGEKVKIKVLSRTGQETSLSMKDGDQDMGKDLNPTLGASSADGKISEEISRNSNRPSSQPLVTAPKDITDEVKSLLLEIDRLTVKCEYNEKRFKEFSNKYLILLDIYNKMVQILLARRSIEYKEALMGDRESGTRWEFWLEFLNENPYKANVLLSRLRERGVECNILQLCYYVVHTYSLLSYCIHHMQFNLFAGEQVLIVIVQEIER